MSHSTAMEPEYILADSVETTRMAKQLLYIGRTLLDLEVDMVVSLKQRNMSTDMLERIINSLHELRLSVPEQE